MKGPSLLLGAYTLESARDYQSIPSARGWWSLPVTRNWRMTFVEDDGYIDRVNLEDYH